MRASVVIGTGGNLAQVDSSDDAVIPEGGSKVQVKCIVPIGSKLSRPRRSSLASVVIALDLLVVSTAQRPSAQTSGDSSSAKRGHLCIN